MYTGFEATAHSSFMLFTVLRLNQPTRVSTTSFVSRKRTTLMNANTLWQPESRHRKVCDATRVAKLKVVPTQGKILEASAGVATVHEEAGS